MTRIFFPGGAYVLCHRPFCGKQSNQWANHGKAGSDGIFYIQLLHAHLAMGRGRGRDRTTLLSSFSRYGKFRNVSPAYLYGHHLLHGMRCNPVLIFSLDKACRYGR